MNGRGLSFERDDILCFLHRGRGRNCFLHWSEGRNRSIILNQIVKDAIGIVKRTAAALFADGGDGTLVRFLANVGKRQRIEAVRANALRHATTRPGEAFALLRTRVVERAVVNSRVDRAGGRRSGVERFLSSLRQAVLQKRANDGRDGDVVGSGVDEMSLKAGRLWTASAEDAVVVRRALIVRSGTGETDDVPRLWTYSQTTARRIADKGRRTVRL